MLGKGTVSIGYVSTKHERIQADVLDWVGKPMTIFHFPLFRGLSRTVRVQVVKILLIRGRGAQNGLGESNDALRAFREGDPNDSSVPIR